MSVKSIGSYQNVTHILALGASIVTTIVFGIGFLTEKQLIYHVLHYSELITPNYGLLIYLALLAAVFASYLIASRAKHEFLGSILALCAVGAIFPIVKLTDHFYPSPYLLTLAAPAVFHLTTVLLHRLSVENVVAEPLESENIDAEYGEVPAYVALSHDGIGSLSASAETSACS